MSAEPAQAPSWGNPPRAEIFDSGTISLYWRITFIGRGTRTQHVVIRIFSLPTGHVSWAFQNAHFPLAFFVHTISCVLPIRTGEGEPIPSDRGRSEPIPGPRGAIPGPWPSVSKFHRRAAARARLPASDRPDPGQTWRTVPLPRWFGLVGSLWDPGPRAGAISLVKKKAPFKAP